MKRKILIATLSMTLVLGVAGIANAATGGSIMTPLHQTTAAQSSSENQDVSNTTQGQDVPSQENQTLAKDQPASASANQPNSNSAKNTQSQKMPMNSQSQSMPTYEQMQEHMQTMPSQTMLGQGMMGGQTTKSTTYQQHVSSGTMGTMGSMGRMGR